MNKILTPESNMLELSFEDECLKALRAFAYPSTTGGEGQVALDLKRIYALTVKDESGAWTYERSSAQIDSGNEETQASERQATMIEPDPDEFFLSRIGSLDKKFQDLLLQNFHQGGVFYSARTFLTVSLLALGFVPSGDDGHKHHIVCELSPEQLVITESFSLIKLDFLPDYFCKIVCSEDGKLSTLDLKESEQQKITYFHKCIKKLLSAKIFADHDEENLRLKENSKNQAMQLVFNSEQDTSLIEFTVKHTIWLDPKSKEIRIKKLSKEDINLKVQPQLYSLSSGSLQLEFLKFLSPELRYVLPGFFEESRAKSKVKNLILNSYQKFIQLLFNIIFYLIASSSSVKTSFLSPPSLPDESQNSFACRMRA